MPTKKRQDGRYQKKVRISRPGEPARYKYIYASTLREAERKKAELTAQVEAGFDLENNPTVAFSINRWLADREPHVRPQTLQNYRICLSHITDKIGKKKLRDVTVSDARRIYADMVSEHPVQASRAIRFMASVCTDEVDRGVISKNPFKAVRLRKSEPAQKRPLSDDEIRLIEQADLSPRNRALVSLYRYTGMRRNEALALTIDDIDFARHTIRINKTVTTIRTVNSPKTKAGTRIVPMPSQLEQDLHIYINTQHTGEGYLFPSMTGEFITSGTFEKRWAHIKKAVFGDSPPDDFTPHIFRHTYAHDLVANNIPLTTAMLLLGHDNIKTTMGVYAHFGYKDADTDAVVDIYNKRASNRASE